MAREIDETWIEEAIVRYRQIEYLQGEFEAAVALTEVTVHSPDQLVEVVVGASGEIRRVRLRDSSHCRTNVELAESIEAAVAAAGDAAEWARTTLRAEAFRRL